MISKKWLLAVGCSGLLAFGVAACGDDEDETDSGGGETPSGLSGSIRIDGSSTVGPLTSAVAEQFQAENPDVDISVGESGTGGGFEKFCRGETDISDASRQIEEDDVDVAGVERPGGAGGRRDALDQERDGRSLELDAHEGRVHIVVVYEQHVYRLSSRRGRRGHGRGAPRPGRYSTVNRRSPLCAYNFLFAAACGAAR